MAIVTINGISIDPLAPQPVLAEAHFNALDSSASNYILIQTTRPLTKEDKKKLNLNGVKILEHVPEDTYICAYQNKNLKAIRSLPFISWANIYMQGFKVSPALLTDTRSPGIQNLSAVLSKPKQVFSTVLKTVDIVFHKDVSGETVRKKISSIAHLDPTDISISKSKVRITVQSKYLSSLAAIDEVRHIEEVTSKKLFNNIARQVLNAGVSTNGKIYEGEGQVVAIADTGFDLGSTTDVHPAFAGRILTLYALGRSGKSNDPDGHGTHVAGSVLGDGTSTALGISITGTAPKAKLVFQSVLDNNGGLGGLPADLNDLFEPVYKNDSVRIHTNSWGSTVGDGKYDANARELDDFVWNQRDFIICFAAGNEGIDDTRTGRISPGSVSAPGTAKNCITVGATENNRPNFNLTYGDGWPDDFPAQPIASDKVANDIDGMVAFSSRGPTQDHRIKPDVVAPGTYILSTLSRAVSDNNPGWGASGDPLYFYDGGTSMATPLVAGCVAVVREFLNKVHQILNPSAALVKAMLVNGATAIKGQYSPSEAGNTPNNAEGFGRVNLASTIGPFGNDLILILSDEKKSLDTGEEETFNIVVPGNMTTLKATLVWTDPSGEKLQNDLDLIVKAANGKEQHGNVDPDSPGFDRANNVEQVIWTNVAEGNYTVIVKAYNITQSKQSYALVVRVE